MKLLTTISMLALAATITTAAVAGENYGYNSPNNEVDYCGLHPASPDQMQDTINLIAQPLVADTESSEIDYFGLYAVSAGQLNSSKTWSTQPAVGDADELVGLSRTFD